ncbi:Juvenile hormone esterase [Pseudolycoriella hygida]|uniref:Carboxylic ester hydrolase n=1 Tax=Pseudolycoriella hygida TaxID=35572 RepID=A0A9Q0N0L0_9DIPT|nr:Juvenile hormone esterase [Pseudolycoriella hygida]
MIEIIVVVAVFVIDILVLHLQSESLCFIALRKDVFAEGLQVQTQSGYTFCAYTGIPYAKPPIEKDRFEPPKKLSLWKGTKQFTKTTNVCVQLSYETYEVIGNEDCLFLNIFTTANRNPRKGELLPVMFWIHGGSFNVGSAGSDLNRPDFFLEKDILVVTINFRLGPMGYLSYSNMKRNIGLHDQRMALQWIHDNIKYFGGNNSKITLSGWSSGGASVSFHMYSKKSQHLFHQAIMMSGNMLNPWAFESDVLRCTYELFKELNISNSTYVVDELKLIDAYDLIPPVFSDELKIVLLGFAQFCFVPTTDDDFAKHLPHIISRQGTPSNIPTLIGTTSLESDWMMSFETRNFRYPNKNFNISNFVEQFMSRTFDRDSAEKENFIQNFQIAADINHGIHQFVQNFVNLTKQQNVFLYRFSYDKSGDSRDNRANVGAVHGDELKYLFKGDFQENSKKLPREELMSQRMVNLWSNFIKFGNPTPNKVDSIIDLSWPSFTLEEKLLLNIDYDITVEQLSDNDKAFKLWDSIYQCMYNAECDEPNKFLQ